MKGVNLLEKLEGIRTKEIGEDSVLRQVNEILSQEHQFQSDALERLHQDDQITSNAFNIGKLQSARVFHISQIELLCHTYRLRFLSTKYYHQELPKQALLQIRELERQHSLHLQGFKIVAPASHFRLKNADDPMLFAPIGNNYFYLIHKWGNDLHPLRGAVMWPLKNIENLLVFSLIASFLLTFVIRELFFWRYQDTSEFIMLYLFTFKSMAGIILFYGIAMGKNFSEAIWESKFFNG